MRSRGLFARSALVLGLVFLYVPIVSMMVFSFNNSRLVTVWDAAHSPTLKWYKALFSNEQILGAAFLSIRIALMSATAAVVLGTLAGMALARFGPFRGRLLLAGMTTAPIVMPEVITGLSLLLLFVALEQAIGWPRGRGVPTIVIAHITLGMAFVSVVVEARLAAFDRSLEEAALDLGARPAKVFAVITLPLIAPALLAGWLLAFTLSLDDLVIASFTTGPSATTLPMVIFSSVRLGVSPQINALATILLVVVAAAIVIAGRLVSRSRRS